MAQRYKFYVLVAKTIFTSEIEKRINFIIIVSSCFHFKCKDSNNEEV